MKQIITEKHQDRIRRVRGGKTEIIIKTSRKNSDKYEDDGDAYETDEDSYETDEDAYETDEDDFEDDDEYKGNNDEYKDEYEDDKKEHEDDANSQHPNNQTSSEISKSPNSPDTNKQVVKTKNDPYEKLENDEIIELYSQKRPLHDDNDNIDSIIDALCFELLRNAPEYVDAVSTGVMPVTLDILKKNNNNNKLINHINSNNCII